ncbi:MAG: DUF72 domain-containing protein [Simplicispira sp.]|nr:DUF72 domain-containing protein [Simplicispira sp.]
MQDDLFGLPPGAEPAPVRKRASGPVMAAPADAALVALAAALPPHLRLGTSSWAYPGWNGLVWDGDYPDAVLSKEGLSAYARHPLLRCVGIDRSFYRPLTVGQYERYAAQVPPDFRFVVKAPSLVTDALVRSEDGRGRQANPNFLNPELAWREFVQPALEGLGAKVGALVFQISPLPRAQLNRWPELLQRLRTLLRAQPPLAPTAPDGVLAVEVRDPECLTPEFAAVLREAGATYCLGLHAKMPRLQDQLPLLRALWPAPLVCRWNLNPLHGAYGYDIAEVEYSPYDQIIDPDLDTRALLARTIAGVTGAGQNAFVTVSNQAEGCSPLSVRALAQEVVQQATQARR